MVKNLEQRSTKAILIGFIYRHPTKDSNKFLDDFLDCMEKLADEKKRFYIIGDINIDINRTNQNSPQADRYMQVITSNGAFSLITKPTRVTDKTATVIDHIITNDTAHSILPRVVRTSLTDHYAIMCKISKIESLAKNYLFLSSEIKKKLLPEAFSDNLDWELRNLISNDFLLNRDNFN